MNVIILGSGTSTGVPMVGCHCRVCTSSDPLDKRTRASLLVEHDGRYILVDTSTDLRKQAIREGIPRIDAVLFTHSHADHIHGIDDLRGFHFIHQRVIPCYGSEETIETIARNFSYIFKGMAVAGYAPLLEPHVAAAQFCLFGCSTVPIPLLHGTMPATGYRFNNTAYLTDCSAIPDPSLDLSVSEATRIFGGSAKDKIFGATLQVPFPDKFRLRGRIGEACGLDHHPIERAGHAALRAHDLVENGVALRRCPPVPAAF